MEVREELPEIDRGKDADQNHQPQRQQAASPNTLHILPRPTPKTSPQTEPNQQKPISITDPQDRPDYVLDVLHVAQFPIVEQAGSVGEGQVSQEGNAGVVG